MKYTSKFKKMLAKSSTETYEDLVDYLDQIDPRMEWFVYPVSTIEDVRDTFYGVFFAQNDEEKRQFIDNMIDFYQSRIKRYRHGFTQAMKAINRHTQNRNPYQSRLVADKIYNDPKATFAYLEWLDTLVDYRKHNEGVLYDQYKVDTWLLMWLNKQKQELGD